jgi:predicted small integral membrane protein
LAGSSNYDFGWFVVTILMALAFVPVIVAIVVTLWAATRPSVKPREA